MVATDSAETQALRILRAMRQTLALTEQDLEVLHALRPHVDRWMGELVEVVFDALTRHEVPDDSMHPPLRTAIESWLASLGNVTAGNQLLRTRLDLGRACLAAGIGPRQVDAAANTLRLSILLHRFPPPSPGHGTDLATSLSKALALDLALVHVAYRTHRMDHLLEPSPAVDPRALTPTSAKLSTPQ